MSIFRLYELIEHVTRTLSKKKDKQKARRVIHFTEQFKVFIKLLYGGRYRQQNGQNEAIVTLNGLV